MDSEEETAPGPEYIRPYGGVAGAFRAVLRTFAEISGLNVVIDPTIQGTVDVSLKEVPWDQALDIILRANKLGYAVESPRVLIESLSEKVGWVALVLGSMHFFNLYVFSRLRRRARINAMLPPVEPSERLPMREPTRA